MDDLVNEKIEEVATMLESLAQRVRRKKTIGGTAMERAISTVTEINWGFANLPIEALLQRAQRADRAK